MVAWIATAIILLTVPVSIAVAYLFDETDSLENAFEPVFVSCEVQGEFEKDAQSNIAVKNTGDIHAYVRVFLLVTWVSDTDGSVYAGNPQKNTDYTLTAQSANWSLGNDGFYYYKKSVYANGVTDTLIGEITEISQAPDGYSLTVQVFASAIQANPPRAVEETWGITVSENGELVAP